MKAAFYLLIILNTTILPQQGWFHQNPLPTGSQLNDLSFIDSDIGWAVGDAGTILKTTNGGESWIRQISDTKANLNGVSFTDEYNGTAVGYIYYWWDGISEAVIIRTIDGGSTWITQYKFWGDINFYSVFFVDVDNGWVVGNAGTILRTTDGGINWEPQISGTQYDLNAIYFTDINNGTAVGYNKILRTSDGGDTWITQYSSIYISCSGVYFSDINNGWVVGNSFSNGIILNTTNGGNNWETQTLPNNHQLREVSFFDELNGIAVGNNGIIYKTTDGGQNWNQQNSGSNYELKAVSFQDLNNANVVGGGYYGGSEILRTTDAGQTWLSQSSSVSNDQLEDIYFIDENNGWATGGYGTLLKTTNGGDDWIYQFAGTGSKLFCIYFINEYYGIVCGEIGTILRTTDGGTSWIPQSIGTNAELSDISFSDENNGWIVGSGGVIYRTTDGGFNWMQQISGISYNLHEVQFINEYIGAAVGDEGIIRTTNGGVDWFSQPTGFSIILYDILFLDTNNVIAIGGDGNVGTILRSTNGGNDWLSQTSDTLMWPRLRSVYFTDSNNGTIVGGNIYCDFGCVFQSIILKTSDGGETWQEQASGTNFPLYTVHFTNTNTGTAVGEYGTILRIEDDVTSVNEEQPEVTPINFFLSQNYPNPFNPSTTISWQSPVGSWQTLKVYDLLGREVATLVDEYKPAGRYEVEFDGSKLSSGAYLYKLTAGEFTSVKKLMLLK
jgi:photosystem II stability/assembly factor-like uncharacterized protein